MTKLLVRIIANMAALYLAQRLVSGFRLDGSWTEYLIAGGVLGILNLTVRPILKLISFPLIILTLGLFTLVINGLILWLVAWLVPFVHIAGLMALIWATIVVTVVNVLATHTD